MPELAHHPRHIFWSALGIWTISRVLVFRGDNGVMQIIGVALSAWIIMATSARSARQQPRGDEIPPRSRRHVLKPGGDWLGAPVAEIDKSTTGQLLAGRLRRNPEIQISHHPAPAEPVHQPPRRDALWDRELDGGL